MPMPVNVKDTGSTIGDHGIGILNEEEIVQNVVMAKVETQGTAHIMRCGERD